MPSATYEKQWLVQKYGGTSIGKFLQNITGEIVPRYLEGYRVALVCSAISGIEKETGTTSLLSTAMTLATSGSWAGVENAIRSIREEHFGMLEGIYKSSQLSDAFDSAKGEVAEELNIVQRLLCDIQAARLITPEMGDKVISTGEKLACILVVASLMAHGISAKLVSLHDVVAAAYGPDPEFQQAELHRLGPRFFHPLATEIAKSIRSCEAGGSVGICVPVVTGYFGSVPKSLITSVGKGYSDFCAALCASGLSAAELQIWKEVDGVFTADPRKISSARLLSTLTLEEARELTHYGSQVIHPFTMDQLRHGGIPLRLKNVLRPQGNGTIIVPTPSSSGTCTPLATDGARNLTALQVSFLAANSAQDDALSKGKPTAITSKSSIVLVNIQSNREAKSLRFLTDVFQRLDELHALVDLSTSSEQSVSVALSINNNDELIPIIASLESCGKVDVLHNMAIIAIIGQRMKSTIGVAAQIFSVLARDGVNIYFIGQGATEINISVVVDEVDALRAMDNIHTHVLGIPHQNNAIKGLVIGPWLY